MIGLDIKVKNEYSNYLYKIFNGIDVLNYVWEINANDFIYPQDDDINRNFFGTDILSGEEFLKCISRDNYYMIFADIKAYLSENDRIPIKTLEDFLKSSCEMVFLCTDVTFIEFYSKDRKLLDKVYNNCGGDDFEQVEYKSTLDISERSFIAW